MSDDQLDDLKQFIDSRISQTKARFDVKLDEKIDGLRNEMGRRFHEVQSAIANTMDVSNEAIDEKLASHEQRLTKLEQQTA